MNCLLDYDAEAEFGECKAGLQKIKYKWREGTPCNTKEAQLPPDTVASCSKCQKGFFISPSGICQPCPRGCFSRQEDSTACEQCTLGKYAELAVRYYNLQEMPADFETQCVKTVARAESLCGFNANWIVANNGFTISPHIPTGIKLILRTQVEVKELTGKIIFHMASKDGIDYDIESLHLRIDNDLFQIEDNFENKHKYEISKGKHVIEWIYTKLKNEEKYTPLLISQIKIYGGKGTAKKCLHCPMYTVSTSSHTNCEKCPVGFTPSALRDKCEYCPENKYKTKSMEECQNTPKYTKSDSGFSSYRIHQAFLINNEYFLDMELFNSKKVISQTILRDLKHSNSFFGPFSDSDGANRYFFSLTSPTNYNIEKYHYMTFGESESVGHIFGLFMTNLTDHPDYITGKKYKTIVKRRVLHNLGSRLSDIDFSHINKGIIKLEYDKGDLCGKKDYKSFVTLECDKSSTSLMNMEVHTLNDPCEYYFHWKTPYACSYCKADKVGKLISPCEDSKRKIQYKENSDCISVGLEFDNVPIVEIQLNNGNNKQKIVQKTAQGTYKGFVIDNIYHEQCSVIEFSSKQIFIAFAIVCVAVVVTGALIYFSFQYRKQYYNTYKYQDEGIEMKEEIEQTEEKDDNIEDDQDYQDDQEEV